MLGKQTFNVGMTTLRCHHLLNLLYTNLNGRNLDLGSCYTSVILTLHTNTNTATVLAAKCYYITSWGHSNSFAKSVFLKVAFHEWPNYNTNYTFHQHTTNRHYYIIHSWRCSCLHKGPSEIGWQPFEFNLVSQHSNKRWQNHLSIFSLFWISFKFFFCPSR